MPQTSHFTSTYGLLIVPLSLSRFQNKQNPLALVMKENSFIAVLHGEEVSTRMIAGYLCKAKKQNKTHIHLPPARFPPPPPKKTISSCGCQQWVFTAVEPPIGPGTEWILCAKSYNFLCQILSMTAHVEFLVLTGSHLHPFLSRWQRPRIGSRQKCPHNTSHRSQASKSGIWQEASMGL